MANLPRWLKTPEFILSVLLFLGAFLLRLVYMHAGLLHCDEAILAQAVERSADTGTLHGAVGGRYGAVLLNLIAYVPYHAMTGGNAEKVVLLTAIVAGAGLVVALALLSKEIFGSFYGAVFAGVFLAANPLFLILTTGGKENTAQAFFVVLGMLLALRGARLGSVGTKAAGFACFTLSVTFHESALVMVPVFLALWLLHEPEPFRRVRRLAVEALVFFGVLAIPLGLYVGKLLYRTLTVRSTDVVSFLGFFSDVQSFAVRELPTAVGWPVLALAVVGAASLLRRPRPLVALALWAATFFYFTNLISYSTRYLFFPMLALVLLASEGARFLAEKAGSPWRVRAAVAALAILVGGLGFASAEPLLAARARYSGNKEIGMLAGRITPPGSIIVTMDMSPFFEYYGGRATLTHPIDDPAAIDAFVKSLHARLAQGEPVYIDDSAFTYDDRGWFATGIIKNFLLEPVGTATGEGWNGPELKPDLFEDRIYRLIPR